MDLHGSARPLIARLARFRYFASFVQPQQQDFTRSEKSPTVRLLQSCSRLYARAYHDVTPLTPSRLPVSGPAILISNHTSGLDPLLIQSLCPRLIRWMMAREYFEHKALQWILSAVGVILVERSGRDMAATRSALRALEQGYVLGVFPEGRIELTRELLPFQSGIGLLAIKTGVPVFPVYLDGTQRNKEMLPAFLERHRATVSFGSPMVFDSRHPNGRDIHAASRAMRDAVEELRIDSPKHIPNNRLQQSSSR